MTEKYNFIDAEYATPAGDEALAPTIIQMCESLEVSKSGYYEWRSRPQSETEKRREILKLKIKALFETNNEEYGYRRLHAALVRGGEQVGEELVRQLMRYLELTPCQPRPWRVSLTEQARPDRFPTWSTAISLRKSPARNRRRYNVHSLLRALRLPRPGHRLCDPHDYPLRDVR